MIPDGFTWPTYLAQSKKEISTENISYTYPQKPFLKQKRFLHSPKRTDFLPKEKNFLNLPEKITSFLYLLEKVFYTYL